METILFQWDIICITSPKIWLMLLYDYITFIFNASEMTGKSLWSKIFCTWVFSYISNIKKTWQSTNLTGGRHLNSKAGLDFCLFAC